MDAATLRVALVLATFRALLVACVVFFLLPHTVAAGQAPALPYASTCPVQVLDFHPDGVSIRIHNPNGKAIVGMTYFVALADATEHWQWLHWDFDYNRNLREFNWNKTIKPNATKRLSWDYSNLDFTHGGGGDFILSSVLFEDGSKWEEPPDRSSCNTTWLNNHKKAFVRPINLPPL